MGISANMLREYFSRQDIPELTGMPAGTFMNANDLGGMMSLIQARQNMPPGILNNPQIPPQLPPQLQRGPVAMPRPQMQGPMSQLAFQMAGQGPQAMGRMRIPTPPIVNPMGYPIPMMNPTDILRGRM